MKQTGHKFTYRHSSNQHSSSVECDEDIAMPELVEAFIDYCLSCGFSQKTIDASLKPTGDTQ